MLASSVASAVVSEPVQCTAGPTNLLGNRDYLKTIERHLIQAYFKMWTHNPTGQETNMRTLLPSQKSRVSIAAKTNGGWRPAIKLHVVTRRWLRQLKELRHLQVCINASIVSKIEGSLFISAQTNLGEPKLARTNAEISLLKTLVERCGRHHTPTTAEVKHDELLPPKSSGSHG